MKKAMVEVEKEKCKDFQYILPSFSGHWGPLHKGKPNC